MTGTGPETTLLVSSKGPGRKSVKGWLGFLQGIGGDSLVGQGRVSSALDPGLHPGPQELEPSVLLGSIREHISSL